MADDLHAVKIGQTPAVEGFRECFPQDVGRTVEVGVDDRTAPGLIQAAEAVLPVHALISGRATFSVELVLCIIPILIHRDRIHVREANVSDLTSIPHAFTARLIQSVRRGALCDF